MFLGHKHKHKGHMESVTFYTFPRMIKSTPTILSLISICLNKKNIIQNVPGAQAQA